MILSHQIPQGCKLYFGQSAKIKRKLENLASEILQDNGYEEIVTPTFAYLQHHRNTREVVRTNNQYNHQIALRNDSTIDTMRLLAPHLEEGVGKKWFYIQPIFVYPTTEIHQIGVENLENCDIAPFIEISLAILEGLSKVHKDMFLQLANVKIPQICAELFAIPLVAFEKIDVDLIESTHSILEQLLQVSSLESLEQFLLQTKDLPKELKEPLEQLYTLAKIATKIYPNCIISPLYYAPMRYYTGLFFRFFAQNSTLILGGEYAILEQDACGFGIYTDDLIQYLQRSICA